MPSPHCIRAAFAVFAAVAPLSAAARPAPSSGNATFTVFVRAAVIGSEEIGVTREPSGWTITSSGRLGPPFDVVTRELRIRYDADWKALDLTLDATVRGESQNIRTTLGDNTATSEVTIDGRSRVITATTEAEIFFPNSFFAPFEALTIRLMTAAPGSTIVAFTPSQTDVAIRVGESTHERIQTPGQTIEVKHTQLTFTPQVAGARPIDAEVWANTSGRLLRLSVPAQALEVIRADLASVSTRRVPISRPNDEQVTIRGNGFVLMGTLSRPAVPTAARLPAILLVGGNSTTDRDELTFGVAIFGQLADAIADAGFAVLRYDKRGVGQSGGRVEAATLADYADDVRAAVKFLAERKDIDSKRIAVLGHSEGGPVAMLAAKREKRIAALALVATFGTTGAELNLEQVKHALDRSNRTEADKQATLALQKQIQQAVVTGTGWDKVATYRQRADTPWFQSFLTFDPARVMNDIRQPILIVQGTLDTQVLPAHAERLRVLANQRKKAPATQIVKVPGVNHLLVPATTGEADEYATLKDKRVSAHVSGAIVEWLRMVLAK